MDYLVKTHLYVSVRFMYKLTEMNLSCLTWKLHRKKKKYLKQQFKNFSEYMQEPVCIH